MLTKDMYDLVIDNGQVIDKDSPAKYAFGLEPHEEVYIVMWYNGIDDCVTSAYLRILN